jgi:hypothetical protein
MRQLPDNWDSAGVRYRSRAGFPNRYETASLLELIKASSGLDKSEREATYATICAHILKKLRGRRSDARLYD